MLNFKTTANRLETDKELPGWLSGAVIAGVAALLVAFELRRALRPVRREPKLKREIRNLTLAAGAGIVVQYAERPLSHYVARQVSRRKWGLAPLVTGNRIGQVLISVAILDYGLYIWHVLTHRVPWLWRFHLVHHVDLDLDASTALRFHVGEMALSIPWRMAQIAIAGASPLSLSIWQTCLFASILFHHSNVRLPARMERLLGFVVMTPRLHGIHHRANRAEADSNWSSGLAVWDLIHGTWRGSGGDAAIGVPAYQQPLDVTIARCVAIPFRAQENDWEAEVPLPSAHRGSQALARDRR